MRTTTLQLKNKIATNPHKVRNILIGLYILIILGFSASARAERIGLQLNQVKASLQTQKLVGEVVLDTSGRSYLVVSDIEFYLLTSERGEDFSRFNGSLVGVEGVVFNYRSGPVLTTQFSSPLLDDREVEKKSGPMLVVIEIYELPETAVR